MSFGKFTSVLALLFTLVAGGALHAQSTGSLAGSVTDSAGGAVVGAKVTLTAPSQGVTRQATTDDNGRYIFPLLGVSTFNLRVEMSGFQPAEAKDVRLQVDEHRELDFKLAPASVTTSVEVTATAVEVQTSNPTLGQVITAQQVADLPLNGRDFVQLATLTPGVTQETNPGSFFNGGPSSEVSARGSFSLSVGGSRANSTDWLLDGNDNNELTAGGISILPSIDAIQEFKVLTYNYSAEWGTRAGPTVLVTTKNGTDQFHGTAFEFLRNTSLDARSFFATSTEKFNLNQFGLSVGGPIKKDKTFFFADFEQKYQRHGIPFVGLVPSVAQRTGDFTKDPFGQPFEGQLNNPHVGGAANTSFQCDSKGNPMPVAPDGSQQLGVNCNKIPQGLINPISAKMIALYPLPNANNPALGYNYVSQPVRTLDEGKFDIRIDENLSNKDTLFARFSYDQAVSYVPGGSPGFAEQNPFASNQGILNHGRNVAISETHVFSPNMVNQFNAGYNRIFNYISSQGTGSCLARTFGIPGANLGPPNSCGLTSTQLDGGYWSLGDRGFSPFQGGTNVWSFSDTFDFVQGAHNIKIGFGFRANQMNVNTSGFGDGYWIFTGLWAGEPQADLLLGLPSLAIHDQTFNGTTTGRRWKVSRPFIEDSWRATKDLTINIGLAWSLATPESEAHNRMANFDPATGKFFIAGQGASSTAGINFDMTALEPRIGVAWKPWGSQKTAIRGGYAIFHDSSWSQGAQGLWQNPPYYAESDYFGFGGECTFATAACATKYGLTPTAQSVSDGFEQFTKPPVPAEFTGTIQSQNRDFKQGRVQQFNVNIEREIPGQILLTAGYAGSRGSHMLIDGNNLNVGSPGACGTVKGYTLGCGPGGSAFDVPYPDFAYSTIANINDIGKAHYNSFQIKAETKSARYGIYALIGYTYARAYDNGLSDGLGTPLGATYFPLPGWQQLDWALSQINLNNSFTASVIYELPIGKGRKFGTNWSGAANAIAGNWEVTLIEKITSGFPVFIVDSNNASGVNFQNNGNSLNRPNQTCNPGAANQSLAEWFNTSCFGAPASGELGTASRTPVNGPGFVNTDFSVIKHILLPYREGLRLDFRMEAFNLFNHPQFGTPAGDFNSPATFGVVNSTVNNPRLFQFALKLAF
ncbi:MAG TPA: carboxypeptidase-like regulatory domain-containing protein [Bryobacteraceae bacterium]|nr:carboxypeptidase-like regulatory domain-containing protein [Bryobacteraceae bacterium]